MSHASQSPISEDRKAFIARVSRVLGRSSPVPPDAPPPRIDENIARVVGPGADLLATFVAAASASGMFVRRVPLASLVSEVTQLLRSQNARRVAIAVLPELASIAAAVGACGATIIPQPASAGFQPLYNADVGITDVHAAIAETGSLVCRTSPHHSRGVSLVPPVHIAIVRTSDILPDLIDLWSSPAANLASSSNLVLITGPSKTADIEGILITGVHGPREVHIFLIDDA